LACIEKQPEWHVAPRQLTEPPNIPALATEAASQEQAFAWPVLTAEGGEGDAKPLDILTNEPSID
jgi:hypothetical protein